MEWGIKQFLFSFPIIIQIQQDEAARIRNESANRTALAAIGRKRPLPPTNEESGGEGPSSQPSSTEGGGGANISMTTSSLFAPLVSVEIATVQSIFTASSVKRIITSRVSLSQIKLNRQQEGHSFLGQNDVSFHLYL